MYYKKVNRGLAFTRPGLASIVLILAVGMIAIVSGINGLYMFLAMGLAGFVISGLLSERTMKSCRFASLPPARADAHDPFPVEVELENRGRGFTVFGLEIDMVTQRPRIGFVRKPLDAPIHGYVEVVPASGRVRAVLGCRGLPRGVHEDWTAVLRTTYPFGILDKFKMTMIQGRLTVVPRCDQDFLESLRRTLRDFAQALAADREFFTHRPLTPLDSVKHVDWKKSAGKPPKHWVTKTYRSPRDRVFLVIEGPYGLETKEHVLEETWEAWLTRLRAALEAAREMGLRFGLRFDGNEGWLGFDECLEALAAIPAFRDRARGSPKGRVDLARASHGAECHRLLVSAGSHEIRRVSQGAA